MGYDFVTWGAFACMLSALGGALSWRAWRRRGPAAGLRGLGWSLLPLAAWLTGTLHLAANLAGDVATWTLDLVFSPVVWLGVVLAGVAVVLLGTSGVMRARGLGGRSSSRPTKQLPERKKGQQARTGDGGTGLEDIDDIEAILRKHGISSSPPATALDEAVGRQRLARRLAAAVADLSDPAAPLVVVDLDAFEANAADLARRAAGKPVRVASKSLRVPALLRRVLALDGFHGVLAYSLREALWLVSEGVSDDMVLGYPSVDRGALRSLAVDDRGPRRPSR